MSTSQTSLLSDVSDSGQIPSGTFGYFRARHRSRVYELVINEFISRGLIQADLARKMGKTPDQICRWLGAPGNWTLDTVSDLLFAISGGEPVYSISYPLNGAVRNFRKPEWLENQEIKQEIQDSQGSKSGLRAKIAKSALDCIGNSEQ